MTETKIVPYELRYQQEITKLVIDIQHKEFGLPLNLHQPDLVNIEGFFSEPESGFWIALQNDEVVGTVGLKLFSPALAALRKMFVCSERRGSGIAAGLLREALTHARESGCEAVYLGTVDKYKRALQFYANQGFIEVAKDELPEEFPRAAVDTRFFVLHLNSI